MEVILVAIDGSKHSERVVDRACELAKATSARMILLYAIPRLTVPEEYAAYARTERTDSAGYLGAVGEQLIKRIGSRIEEAGIRYEGVSEVGNPFEEILRVARARKATMIVLGLRGLHGLARMRALGSTARRVLENSSVPVVVVP